MPDPQLIAVGATHQLYHRLLVMTGRDGPPGDPDRSSQPDRGAVSLEQVLWFAAAGVIVAAVAYILLERLRETAEEAPLDTLPSQGP